MSNSDTSSRAYIARIQAQNIVATVASGGRGSNSGNFDSFLSTTLGSIQSVIDLPPGPPGTPTLFVATPDDTSIRLSWHNVGRVTGAIIDISSGDVTTSTEITGSGNTYTITDLSAYTLYSVRVTSFNTVGLSAPTEYKDVTTLPARPTDLSAIDISFTEVCLEWTDNVVGDISGHNIKYSAYPYSSSSTIFVELDPAVGIPYWRTVTGLVSGKFYRFNVATVTLEDGNSAFSDTLTVGTIVQPPDSLACTIQTNTTVNLSWMNYAQPINAVIQYSLTGIDDWTTWIHSQPITGDRAIVTGLTGDGIYDFRVATVGVTGTSDFSPIYTTGTLPNAPTDVSGSQTEDTNNIQFTWGIGNSTVTDCIVEILIEGAWITGIFTVSGEGNEYGSGGKVDMTGYSEGSYRFRASIITGNGTSLPSAQSDPIYFNPVA